MATNLRDITIVFKAGAGQTSNHQAHYQIAQAELDRLANDFAQHHSGIFSGVYDVEYDNTPRKLMLYFSEVLYIG